MRPKRELLNCRNTYKIRGQSLPEQGFTNRVTITIAASDIDADLTDWTLLFDQSFSTVLTNDNGPLHPSGSRSSKNGGGDVRFSSDPAGTNRLACDIRQWNTSDTAADRKCEVAVKVPAVSSSLDTTIYLWWEHASSAGNQPAATEVYGQYAAYDDHYIAVYPMGYDETAGGASCLDRTSHTNHATPANTNLDWSVAGPVGRASRLRQRHHQRRRHIRLRLFAP